MIFISMDCINCKNHCCGQNKNLKAPILLPNEVDLLKESSESFIVDDITFYRLKRSENGNCIFLGENNRCTIYNDRPYECRIYPYILTQNGLILHDDCFDVKNVFSKPIIPQLDDSWLKTFDKIEI